MMLALAIVVLLLAAAPLALACWNLLIFKVPRTNGVTSTAVSVLIPARNEERHIAAAVQSVLCERDRPLELLVLDDGSTDGTRAILDAIDDPRLRVIEGSTLPGGWCGKQHACAMLAEHASYDTLVFMDADVCLCPGAIARFAASVDETVGLASFFPRQTTRSWSEWMLIPLIHLLLLGYLPIAVLRRSPLPALGAGCGQLMVARRTAYRRAGGHAAIRASLHDGITLPRAFRRAGIMTDIFDATTLATCRMYETWPLVLAGLSKNATEGMATARALPLWTLLLAGGHVAPYGLMLLAPSPLAFGSLAATLGLRVALAARFRQHPLGVLLHPFAILLLLAIQWRALLRARHGEATTWRGRIYPSVP